MKRGTIAAAAVIVVALLAAYAWSRKRGGEPGRGQEPAAPAPKAPRTAGTLTILMVSFRNDKGAARVAVFRSSEGFPNGSDKACRLALERIENGAAKAVCPGLPYGEYGVAVLHDENENGEMERGALGIPAEGYGFSNNARGSFGPPSFSQTTFRLDSETLTIRIAVQYH